jgi:hypothetical protein
MSPAVILALKSYRGSGERTVIEEHRMEDIAESMSAFEPEPVIREVMEYLAKNLSLKIKLVKMLQDGEVQSETFERLFESYSALGGHLMKTRNDMIQRISYDLDSMDEALRQAKIGLEELKIKMKIGDVSDEEYQAKAPAFEWDIGQYDDKVSRKKGEKAFLESLTLVMPTEDIEELRAIGESSLEDIEELVKSGKIPSETADKVKLTLEEALTYLNTL